MMTLADLNHLWPADHNATPWVATPDGSWTRIAGSGVNPDRSLPISLPHKQGRRNAPVGPINLATAFRDSLSRYALDRSDLSVPKVKTDPHETRNPSHMAVMLGFTL
jgi:hypothetical protein